MSQVADDDNRIEPTADEARAHLRQAADARRAVASEGSAAAAAWLAGLGAASALYLASLGWVWRPPEIEGVVAMSVIYALTLAVLAVVHLRRVRATSEGFSRRFGVAMTLWGAAFGVALGVGLALFTGVPVFFVVAAVVVAIPPLWASQHERTRHGRIE